MFDYELINEINDNDARAMEEYRIEEPEEEEYRIEDEKWWIDEED